MVFVGDHWTDKFKQVKYTSLVANLVDENFEMRYFDLCVREYDDAFKYVVIIKEDLMKKLTIYVRELNKVEGKFVFVSNSDPKLVAVFKTTAILNK